MLHPTVSALTDPTVRAIGQTLGCNALEAHSIYHHIKQAKSTDKLWEFITVSHWQISERRMRINKRQRVPRHIAKALLVEQVDAVLLRQRLKGEY